jgi:hypothetical protein
MRHFLLFFPVAALTFSVGMTASPRGLIALPRSTNVRISRNVTDHFAKA